VRAVPHHIFEELGRLLLDKCRDRLGVVHDIKIAGNKLSGLIEAI
jgi:hypothetical protein